MDMSVDFAGIKMKNPVMVSSGTFGYGKEFSELFDLNILGGIITKGTSLKPKAGNAPPRICETPGGLLNAIGLQNPGVEYVVEHYLPWLRKFDAAVIVNACGGTVEDCVDVCKILDSADIDGVELNLSCPNVKAGGGALGGDYETVKEVTGRVRRVLSKPLIVKLTPNVSDIASLAKGAEDAGADAVSLVNTFLSMCIDINTRRPILGNNTGGLSGPAIRPIAVRMVYEAAQAVRIPVLGMGGIVNGNDAIEFILAGATAISIGTGNFYDPVCSVNTVNDIESYMEKHGVSRIKDLVGAVILNN
ncbi:MAG: dihydroorotate dehydrogenase [Synergistaceae bacterium]|jgi:dihydroorotate dehydrogenase (NAD+) catalytic subunit|nr:dihydroorotate dehydrogenase [Synergistaceae bacterium]